MMLKNQGDFIFQVYDESELDWRQHNEIHKALNIAYSHRTHSFLKKSYSETTPIKRILCTRDEQLIGHIAIFSADLIYCSEQIAIGGIGMTLALTPFYNLGFELRKRAIEICIEMKYPLAIGRVKNTSRVKEALTPLVTCFLDIPLLGKTSESHDWETLAIYNTHYDPIYVNNLIHYFYNMKNVRIAGEVF